MNLYIWHCPSDKCKPLGTILFKTEYPFIGNGAIKCNCCGNIVSFIDIVKFNKKNIEKYLKFEE